MKRNKSEKSELMANQSREANLERIQEAAEKVWGSTQPNDELEKVKAFDPEAVATETAPLANLSEKQLKGAQAILEFLHKNRIPMGSSSREHEIHIEWEYLVNLTYKWLLDFPQIQSVLEINKPAVWSMWTKDLGDFGAIGVSEEEDGQSTFLFSGLGFQGLLSNEVWEAKRKLMRKIIDSYYVMLTKENMFFDIGFFPEKEEIIPGVNQKVHEDKGTTPLPISDRTQKLNKLAVLWVQHRQVQSSQMENLSWFIDEYAPNLGLPCLTTYQFKKHLPKAWKAKEIDKKGRYFIPK